MSADISRRRFVGTAGALVVAFASAGDVSYWRVMAATDVGGAPRRAAASRPGDPSAPAGEPPLDALDSWLAIGADGGVTLYSGKVELGTGVQTALAQIVAEELDFPVASITVVQGTTGRTPNQGSTTGSKTVQTAGPAVRRAAATARQILVALAATRLGAPVERLEVRHGVVAIADGGEASVSFGALFAGHRFDRAVDPHAPLKRPAEYTVVGQPSPRLDLPDKIFGTHLYVHNVRIPGMLHGRVVRPPAPGATLQSVDETSVQNLPGAVRVVRRGDFLGVVAEREEQAIDAARALRAVWGSGTLGSEAGDAAYEALYDRMRADTAPPESLANVGDVAAALRGAAVQHTAEYRTPYQSHGSIGPSCAVADVRSDGVTVWSGTQGAYALRDAIADLLGVPAAVVSVIWTEASGCYGHNGADDAAADAAVLSQAIGRPVRVQWSRQEELGWDPKGPAMLMQVRAGLDGRGDIVAWDYMVTTPTHASRPGGKASNLLAGQLMGRGLVLGTVGGDRNAPHSYAVPNNRVAVRWTHESVLRPSAMRGLGAPANVFAIESFMDELAARARTDPVQFRLRHLRDPRAAAVLERAADLARWDRRPSPAPRRRGSATAALTGRGIAFLQYENAFAYVATVATVEVDPESGAIRVRRMAVAHDCGLVVNPDGLRNQIEGATIQSISRTLEERVTWGPSGVTSVDWSSYPILTFPAVPDAIDIALLDRRDAPAWGAGEPAACPVAAAIANAVFDATGARLRELPFTPTRVKQAMAAAPVSSVSEGPGRP